MQSTHSLCQTHASRLTPHVSKLTSHVSKLTSHVATSRDYTDREGPVLALRQVRAPAPS